MNNNIISQIEINTKLDKKDFLATYAKVGEEVGELAKEMLSYLNEPTNHHRYSSKKNILEECVDSILTLYSLALKTGANQEDIEEMMELKLSKWSTILSNEGRLKDIDRIPFEYHCTFEHNNLTESELRTITNICDTKLVILEVKNKSNETYNEYMTSNTYYGKNSDAIQECENLAEKLSKNGLNVIRKKVETVPWHPLSPQKEKLADDNGYFEAHIEIPITIDSIYELHYLTRICKDYDAAFSKNIAKKSNDYYIQMVTIRQYKSSRTLFENRVNEFIIKLKQSLFKPSVPLLEYCIYDTNPKLDTNWI